MNGNDLADYFERAPYAEYPMVQQGIALLRQLQNDNDELIKGTVILAKDLVNEQIKNKKLQDELDSLNKKFEDLEDEYIQLQNGAAY